MSENKNQSSNRKSDLLSKEVEHIDITSFDARKIVSSMEKMSFVSRETANAANIYNEMIKDSTHKIISKKLTAFDFYGPTCDSMDYMKGPFLLPNNIKENDYIELGQLGAYGLTFRTNFNGFYSDEIYEVEDNPIMTMYDKETNKEFLVA